jgi:hypothetical protein
MEAVLHIEDLAGEERCDAKERRQQLQPAYEAIASRVFKR